MNHKNTNKSDCNGEQSGPTTPFKVKLNTTFKRQMTDSQNVKNQNSNKPQASVKRVRFDSEFINPWRCDSDPYVPLQIKYHKPKYNPPCYFDENLNKLSKRERALKIMSYHYALNLQLNAFQLAQSQNVLLGDPIQGSHLFNGSLEKKKANSSDLYNSDTFLDEDNTYISRSGRHVRRKRADLGGFDLSEEEDDRTNHKRAKREESPKATATTSTTKRATNNKKLSNDEIMARSALFNDSPVLQKSSRSETMFDKLVEAEKANKKAEMEKSKFQASLEALSDEDYDVEITSSHSPKKIDSNDNQQEDSNFIRKRVVPPSATRKGKNIPSTYTEMPSTSSSSGPNRDREQFGTNNKNAVASGSSATCPNSSTPMKRGPKKKTINCPICGLTFPTKEIEKHASTCGLTSELEIESSIPNTRADVSY